MIRLTGNPRLAWDSYRRLVQGYAEVVADLPTAPFDALVAAAMLAGGCGHRAGAGPSGPAGSDHGDARLLPDANR